MMNFEEYDDEYQSGWTICTRCEIEYAEPDQDICLGCFYDLEEERELDEFIARCAICDNEHLPDSYLCQDCTDYLRNWEKEQWQDIWRDFGSLMKSLRQMLHWTLVERTKEKLRRLLRR